MTSPGGFACSSAWWVDCKRLSIALIRRLFSRSSPLSTQDAALTGGIHVRAFSFHVACDCNKAPARNFNFFGGAAAGARGARGKGSMLTTAKGPPKSLLYCRTRIVEAVIIEMMVERKGNATNSINDLGS